MIHFMTNMNNTTTWGYSRLKNACAQTMNSQPPYSNFGAPISNTVVELHPSPPLVPTTACLLGGLSGSGTTKHRCKRIWATSEADEFFAKLSSSKV